jgi:hypothetical protein
VKRKIKIKSVSRIEVKQAFSECGAANKYEIAVGIANRFPELAPGYRAKRANRLEASGQQALRQEVAVFLAVLICRTCWFFCAAVDSSLFGLSLPVWSSCVF